MKYIRAEQVHRPAAGSVNFIKTQKMFVYFLRNACKYAGYRL